MYLNPCSMKFISFLSALSTLQVGLVKEALLSRHCNHPHSDRCYIVYFAKIPIKLVLPNPFLLLWSQIHCLEWFSITLSGQNLVCTQTKFSMGLLLVYKPSQTRSPLVKLLLRHMYCLLGDDQIKHSRPCMTKHCINIHCTDCRTNGYEWMIN